jgi:hypothetical protein
MWIPIHSLEKKAFFQSELSTFDLTILNQGFQANLRFGISQIQVSIVVTIDEEALVIEVPQDQIYDGPNAKLARLSPYPFIGATKGDRIPGYIMIPDGIGALIRFEKESLFTNVYEKPFYGFDVGTARNIVERTGFVRAEQGLFASVYGMVHGINQHAFLSHIEQGSPYASLVVYPANLTTDFFWTFVNYQYRNVYRQPLNQSQSNAIIKLQDELNPIHLKQKYVFLSNQDANYVGMANTYQNILKQKGYLGEPMNEEDIMLHIDVLAAESKRALFGRSTFVMTNVSQLVDMLDDLNQANIHQIVASYIGTSRYGLTGSSFNEYPFLSDLGSKNDFIHLNERSETIYYQLETTKSYVEQEDIPLMT